MRAEEQDSWPLAGQSVGGGEVEENAVEDKSINFQVVKKVSEIPYT